LSTRDIKAHLQEIYDVEVSPDLISSVTDAVSEGVREWQNRPLDAVYPIRLYLDACESRSESTGRSKNRCIYVAIGVNSEGKKEALGLWTARMKEPSFGWQF